MEKLLAPVGFYYTQAGDVPAGERVFADEVFLGVYDGPENWRLVSEAEREEMVELDAAEALAIVTGNE